MCNYKNVLSEYLTMVRQSICDNLARFLLQVYVNVYTINKYPETASALLYDFIDLMTYLIKLIARYSF
jgi:hypothetical protein